MSINKIRWHEVTWYSKALTVMVMGLLFLAGIVVSRWYEEVSTAFTPNRVRVMKSTRPSAPKQNVHVTPVPSRGR